MASLEHFHGFAVRDRAHSVVDRKVPFATKPVEYSDRGLVESHSELQALDHSQVFIGALSSEAGSRESRSGGLKGGVVGDVEAPFRPEAPDLTLLDIPIRQCEEIS